MNLLDQLARDMSAKESSAEPGEDVRQVIATLSRTARIKRFITLAELVEVSRVKTADRKALMDRHRALLKQNDNETVKDVTFLAFRQTDERIRIDLIRSLHGVDTPVASAVLAWVSPDKWGVIDRRAWKLLHARKLVQGRREGISLGSKQWKEYHEIIIALSARLCWQPQRVDTWLYRESPVAKAEADERLS